MTCFIQMIYRYLLILRTLTPVVKCLSNPSHYTYLLMPEDYDIRDFKDISRFFLRTSYGGNLGKAYKATWRAWLQPLADIHYNSDVGYDLPTGNKIYLYGFMAVAIFILLVACINYMNLATARASKTGKRSGHATRSWVPAGHA